MTKLKAGDKIRVVETAYTDECELIGRQGVVMKPDELAVGVQLYHVDIIGEGEISGEWLLAEFEMELGE
jgi:hypothetical protein